METARYLCEFFFGNVWHFLQLLLVCYLISANIKINSPTEYNTSLPDKLDKLKK